MTLASLFRALDERGASDLHLGAGMPPHLRRHGALEPLDGWPALDDGALRALMLPILSERQHVEFSRTNDLDFAFAEGGARFRVNYFVDERGLAAAFRRIPDRILPLADLGAPPSVEALAKLRGGLVLLTGPTGSGKSTTLAALVDQINRTEARHVVTIEDPVEFVHRSNRSVVSQREVGADAASFADALRAAIRQDADVILVGELRDLETIHLALTAAEMGALVLATLHTNGAAKTVDRVVDAFPPEQQPQVRGMLAESLQAVVAQLLVRTVDGKGRVAAIEVLLANPALASAIREGSSSMIQSIIASGKRQGMQSMDDALAALVDKGAIAVEEAFRRAHDKRRFEPR